MATMALLRVAETAMKTKGDHSDDAVLYSERLHHALTDADDATAKTHAPAALLPWDALAAAAGGDGAGAPDANVLILA